MIFHQPVEQHNPKKDWGRIHVYTGEGKGKTTAALGLALRALGHGYSVLVIQFLKNHRDLGELKFQNYIHPKLQVLQFSQTGTIDLANPSSMDIYYTREGLNHARTVLQAREWRPDLLILDEINVAVHYGLLPLQEMIDFLDNKPQNTEIILTGRYAHPALMEKADLVTEMTPIKHYFTDDFRVRKGLEH